MSSTSEAGESETVSLGSGPPVSVGDAPLPKARSRWHRARRAVRRVFARTLLAIAKLVVPRFYLAYMWVVWKTSRVEDCGIGRLRGIAKEHDGAVALLWHEEVFSVAWAYRDLYGHTLASLGDAGEIIAEMLRRCNFTVFRGGSSDRASRRRSDVLDDMIQHMRDTREVIYGITVDGSMGPKYHLKRGGLAICQACGKPFALVRMWQKRYVRLPTWDGMAIPLPFNHVKLYMRGPFFVPPEADDPAVFEAFRRKVEDDLVALSEEAHRALGETPPPRPPRVDPESLAAQRAAEARAKVERLPAPKA